MLTKRRAQKIKQILPLTDGLFTKMTFVFPEGVSKANLDLLFLANYGNRNPSPVVEIVQSEYGEVLSSSELGAVVEWRSVQECPAEPPETPDIIDQKRRKYDGGEYGIQEKYGENGVISKRRLFGCIV